MEQLTSVVKYLLLPSSWIVLTALAAMALCCQRTTRKRSLKFVIVSLFLYFIFGAGPVAFWLLGHLEYQVPPSRQEDWHLARTLVVLAAHAEPDAEMPLSSRVNSAAASRLLEVLSQCRRDSDMTIIVSGAGLVPQIMRDVLVSAGVREGRIQVDDGSRSTYESGKNLSSMLGRDPFLLVTSAGHMPRAMAVFRKAGGNPQPVPTHYLTRRNWLAIQYLPKPSHLEYSDLAFSEYGALIWYGLNGWL